MAAKYTIYGKFDEKYNKLVYFPPSNLNSAY